MFTYPVGLLKPKVSEITRDGLIGEWLIDGNADDTSGNGNDGTVEAFSTTFPELVSGKNGDPNSSYIFKPGINSGYINFGDPIILRDLHASDFSLSLWLKDLYSNVPVLGTIWSSWDNFQGGFLIRTINGTGGRSILASAFFETTAAAYQSIGGILNDTWLNMICVFNSTTKSFKIYISGVEVSYILQTSGVGSVNSDTGVLKEMGMLSPTNTLQTWNGSMDLIRLYDRQLNQSEITQLANE